MNKKLEFKGPSGAKFAFEGSLKSGNGQLKATFGILKPKMNLEADAAFSEEEYISVPFRFLSATVIPGHELDISEKVLEKAVKLWDKKPVQTDHTFAISANIGVTSKPVWDGGGNPPGVNGWMHINKIRDAAIGQAVSQGLKMGTVESTSVWFFFDWKPSHPDLDEYDFWSMLGQEVNGEMVRIIVTKITDVWEQSLVMLGADPNAKKLSATEPVEPEEDLTNENNNTEEAEMLEQLRKLFAMAEDAPEADVLAAVKLANTKAGKYDEALGKVRDVGETALAALDAAKIEVNPNLKAMLKGTDDDGIRYASAEIARLLADSLPDTGRSSKTSGPKTEEPVKTESPKQNFRLGNL
jgi:hypothetical protein